MMQFLKDNKVYVGGIAVALLCIWAYFTFFSSGEGSSAVLIDEQVSTPLSQDILATLSSLHVIKLDGSIFTDPVFTSLTDYGVSIPPETAGRRNPFAPI